MSKAPKLASMFVGIVVLILVLAAVAPLLTVSSGTDTRTATNASTFDPSTNLVDVPADNGTVTVDSTGESKVVVIDRAHANGFTREQLQPFVRSLVDAGHEVRFHGTGSERAQSPNLNSSLRGADAYVVAAPRRPYTPSEARGVSDFADRGGRVLMLAEPSRTQISGGLLSGLSVERVSTEMTSLASGFGMSVGTGYLYNMHDNANNFKYVYAAPSNESAMTDGVDRTVFPGATPVSVNESSAEPLLTATDRTHLSTTRANSTYTVAARNGNVTLVGDTTFLGPSYYLDADNEALIGNSIEFLVSGEKTEKPTSAQSESGSSGSGFQTRRGR